MSNLELSIPPGFYLEPQVASWVTGAGVDYVVFNQGGAPPAISKYIAYDNLVPPNPFIAVTQDGTGNVVYDGGFPKIYNGSAPAPGSTFAQLSASFKFIYNALKWIANPEKVAAGNKKILILGDSDTSYSVNSTDPNGFRTSLDSICAIAGFVPTYRTASSYAGGLIDCRLTELNNYCAVFLMSSAYVTSPLITNQAVTDLSSFRSQGNGIFVMTDHGQVVTSPAMAVNLTTVSFFCTANKLIVQFGAYFSGDFTRSPVNVGSIRATYGDHPLYAGMTDAESIYAGGSESKVVVAEYTKYYPGSIPNVTIDKKGSSVVQAAAQMQDGSIETYRGFFAIAEGNPLVIKDALGNEITEVALGLSSRLPFMSLVTSLSGAGTVLGEIRRNATKIGAFSYTDDAGATVVWFTNEPEQTTANNGDVITAQITLPFNYGSSVTVSRVQPAIGGDLALAEVVTKLVGANERPLEAVLNKMITEISGKGVSITAKLSTGENVVALTNYFKPTADGSKLGPIDRAVYDTEAEAAPILAAAQVPGGTHNRVVLIKETGNLYRYLLGTWEKVLGANLAEIFGVGRIIENTLKVQRYRVASDGKLVSL